MMLNIAAKEFEEGVVDGKIVVAPEYEESQVFLQQAIERFERISPEISDPLKAEEIKKRFINMMALVKSKVDSQKIWEEVNAINSELLTTFNIEINKTPITPVSLTNGEKIFENNCSVCHGLKGNGDGPMASQFDPSPAVLSNPKLTGDANTTAYDNFEVINVGIANTAMIAWAGLLSENQIWDVTYYLRTFSNANLQLPPVNLDLAAIESSEDIGLAEQVVNEVREVLDRSLVTYKTGQVENAAELAFDAYLAYEKIESNLITKDRDLGVNLESAFSRYRGEIKRNAPLEQVESLHKEINLNLLKGLELLKNEVGFTGMFFQSFSIIVREGFEAILIIAALIAFLVKSRNQARVKSIHIGVVVGILASFATAYIIHEVLHLSMASQEVLEGWIMLIAVAVLFSVSYWLVSKIDNKRWQEYINKQMRGALSKGNTFTLGAVAFISVYREGFETVLFYKALFLYAGDSTGGIIPGFLAGCVVLALIFYLINTLGMRIPIKWFFGFTSVLLYYMAFTFMGKGIHELQMGEQISMTSADILPSLSWLGMYPTWETFIGQAVLFAAFVFALVYTFIIKAELGATQLKEETSQLQGNITQVHDLVEHISHHAKRCEVFLKDTPDQDLQELSGHLKEIDIKIHELFGHVKYVENQLQDEYEKLAKKAFEAKQN
ncbi:MAG: c-type cytochrome [Nitrospina sp.]|nr:c-type cytochrome [Nitrospina sp.]MBT3875845.1 c-type cytochrome [Nitrospina sp.]MBT4049292.1 c-type cytochrome [Nitrospina sp.]MBT4557260.1 c-type cytochrome [Nitrospina sp.]MBT5347532.1 c-type cytochrome [Nitrospina sp.]